MGLDGISVVNLGVYRPQSPSEIASQAEQLSRDKAEAGVKKIKEAAKLKLDLEKENEDEKSNYEGRDHEDGKEDEDPTNNVLQKNVNLKKYKVKFNQITDMVELVDQFTGFVIETITPADLINLLSKPKEISGILVDKAI